MTLSVADRLDISELVSRSHYYADFAYYDEQRSCFTEDTVCVIEGIGQYPGRDWQVDHAKASARNTGDRNRHVVSNLWIEPQEDGSAVARYYMLNVNAGRAPMQPAMVVTGEFRDHVVRVGDAWKVKLRHFLPDQMFPIVNGGV